MTEPKIKGGYILLSRRLVESEIFDKPPLYLKVWIYLLSKAQHKDFKGLKRGQLWTNIPEIQEACSWYVGYRKETPTKKQIYTILEWLRNPCEQDNEGTTKGTMIVTTKATQGLIINIDKYSFYQDSKNYEGNNESNNEGTAKELRREQQGNNIYKNDKNVQDITTTPTIGNEPVDNVDKCSYIDFFNNNFGHLITAFEGETLEGYVKDGIEPDVIVLALKEAVEANIRDMRYVKKVLNRWLDNKLMTVEAVMADKRDFELKVKQQSESKVQGRSAANKKKNTSSNFKGRSYSKDQIKDLENKLLGLEDGG